MKDYTPENPVFSETIKVYETSDPAHADLLNVPLMQIHQNTLVALAVMPKYKYDEETRGIIISLGADAGGGVVPFYLPIATATTLGGVKIGKGINVAEDGTINADLNDMAEDVATIVEENSTHPSRDEIDSLWGNAKDGGSNE